jgi:outer membrane immunogenic protein
VATALQLALVESPIDDASLRHQDLFQMKKLFLATAALVAFGAVNSAGAADLAARPYTKAPAMIAAVYDWSGFYIGANAGYGWAQDSRDNNAGVNIASYDAKGATAGGQIGYRWQTGAWVWGLEGQGNWAELGGNTLITNGNSRASTDVDAFGLITGQLGYAWNNVLVYAKGGAAVVDQRFTFRNAVTNALGTVNTGYSTHWGATAGAGIEVGFAPNWTFGVEYNHIFLDRRDVVLPGALANPYRSGGDLDIVTARLNYKFNWGGPVVAKY